MRIPFFGKRQRQRSLSNASTGMGYSPDKTAATVWESPFVAEGNLLSAYRRNWSSRKVVDILPDDATVRWRSFGGEERVAEAMREQERVYLVRDRIASALKLGRLYGTSLLVMVTTEDAISTPLNIDSVREGDLRALTLFRCQQCAVLRTESDIASPDYGQPLLYEVGDGDAFTGARKFIVHASRVLRFDGEPPVENGGWGDSVLLPVMQMARDEEATATAAASLAQEASVSVIKLDNYRELMRGVSDGTDAQSVLSDISNKRSVYRTVFLDIQDEYQRLGAQGIAGLPPLMDRFLKRLAAAAGVPATRFVGQSPVGLDATGASDEVNYAQTVQAFQTTRIAPQLAKLDEVLLRNAGVRTDEPVEYEWDSLLDISEADLALTAKTKAEALVAGINSGIITEDEAREALDGDAVYGDLSDGPAPGIPVPAGSEAPFGEGDGSD